MGRRDARKRSPPGDHRRRNDRFAGGRRDRSRSPRRTNVHDGRDDRRRPTRRDDYSYRPGDRDGDRRRRSVERDYRDRRDDSRERTTRRRDDSTDSKRKARRDDSRERTQEPTVNAAQNHTATPDPTSQADEAQAKRLAKLDEWKAKQAADRDRKQKELDAAGGTRGLLEEMDRKAAGPPAATPSIPSPSSSYPGHPSLPVLKVIKFDPKAIAKKAALSSASSGPKILGTDVAPIVQAQTATSLPSLITAPETDETALNSPSNSKKVVNVRKIDLGSRQGATITGQKRTFDLGEEESARKKLIPLSEDITSDHAPVANDEDVDDNDFDEANSDDEEGQAAAVLAAARIREERYKAEEALENGEVQMEDVIEPVITPHAEEEEQIDPLDAYMASLTSTVPSKKFPLKKPKAGTEVQPEALFDDNNDYDYDQVVDKDDLIAPPQKKIKKDLPKVDHSKLDYPSFRKAFYIQPSEMAEMTEEEVTIMRAELENIKVRGLDVPRPVRNFAQCGLGVQTLDVIQRLKYQSPTSIQAQAIPAVMAGRDVIGVAKTGSGKTIAFLLPMFRHIMDQPPLEPGDGPIALIMTPTRELAVQTRDACKPFAKALKLRAACVYGGAPIKDQIADMKRGAEIVVCTPGRVIEVLTANQGRVTNLRRVTYVVLDEADRMFDMGFEPQVVKILGNIRPNRQIVLFSATFPAKMESLARKTLTKPVEIVVGGRSVVAPEITQKIQIIEKADKFTGLLKILGDFYHNDESESDRTLIFVDRQEAADTLLHELLNKGYASFSIHGGKDQIDRDSAIDDFKRGVVPILIATSVAARGLDVKQLKLVVNYDAPNHLEDYVHRAGRTGRAGNKGTCVTFVAPEQDRYAVDIVKALRQSEQDIPQELQAMADSFLQKVKDGKEKASASGFGGKGLEKLDLDRNAAKARERKTYGNGEGNEDEEQEEDVAKLTKPKEEEGKSIAPPPVIHSSSNKDLTGTTEDKIIVHRSTPATTSAPTDDQPPNAGALERVRAAANRVGSRLGKKNEIHHGQPIDNKGPDAGLFHATLEINDYPQKARWAVTNRTNVAKILETYGVSITTKGEFYPLGKDALPDKPKLYILVEGDTENQVTAAMRELLRLLREGVSAAEAIEARMPVVGRYSVV